MFYNYVQDRVLFILVNTLQRKICILKDYFLNKWKQKCIYLFCWALSRSRDRPLLVRGAWSETHRALWEEAQPRRGSGQRGGEIYRQDAAAAQQPEKRAETGQRAGCRRQGLVPVKARPPPP